MRSCRKPRSRAYRSSAPCLRRAVLPSISRAHSTLRWLRFVRGDRANVYSATERISRADVRASLRPRHADSRRTHQRRRGTETWRDRCRSRSSGMLRSRLKARNCTAASFESISGVESTTASNGCASAVASASSMLDALEDAIARLLQTVGQERAIALLIEQHHRARCITAIRATRQHDRERAPACPLRSRPRSYRRAAGRAVW